jgi:asparagine synthase (glutamine-hydrolysing)
MCGIVGFLNCGAEEELRNATISISHRGPDNQTVKWFPNSGCGLGHTRLSIIDLADTAHQPMHDRETGNWIVFNGEIYNYQEIKKELEHKAVRFVTNSDTEVILKAYQAWGMEMLQKLNGMFAFCIFNEYSKNAILVRDRLGIKPLYYHLTKRGLAFSSEIKAILKLREYKASPDFNSLQTPVHYRMLHGI